MSPVEESTDRKTLTCWWFIADCVVWRCWNGLTVTALSSSTRTPLSASHCRKPKRCRRTLNTLKWSLRLLTFFMLVSYSLIFQCFSRHCADKGDRTSVSAFERPEQHWQFLEAVSECWVWRCVMKNEDIDVMVRFSLLSVLWCIKRVLVTDVVRCVFMTEHNYQHWEAAGRRWRAGSDGRVWSSGNLQWGSTAWRAHEWVPAACWAPASSSRLISGIFHSHQRGLLQQSLMFILSLVRCFYNSSVIERFLLNVVHFSH